MAQAACSAIKRLGIVAPRVPAPARSSRVADIAQRHADIAEEAAALDPLDRRPAKKRPKLRRRRAPGNPATASDAAGRAAKAALAGDRGEAIPRAGVEAIVAAIDAVADERTELERDRAFELDREIGNAATRIEPMRLGDRAGRAGRDAARATAAARLPAARRAADSSVVRISPRKNQVPSLGSISIVLLPCQPMPASAA